jgi:hypothetical protein
MADLPASVPKLPTTLAQIKDERIKESSGVAPSLTVPGAYFTHNDSGNAPKLFRFQPESGKVEEWKVGHARNVDWEDIASAYVDGRPYLFVGDIGDNPGRRKSIVVYRVPEPESEANAAEPDARYELRYPDEPHNAETLMVHPETGDIYVVTKAALRPSMVFKVDRPTASGSYVLRKLGELSLGGEIRESKLVTGGAISPDGRKVVLRTYMGAYEFGASGRFDDWFKSEPRKLTTNFDGQGEGITYTTDGEGLVTTSEGTPMLVSLIPLK